MKTKASVTSEAAPANDGQKKQIVRMLQDAVPLMVERADMSFDGAQRVIDDSTEMLNAHRDAVRALLVTHAVTNKFANEEVRSSYTYPNGYKVKGITEQTNILRDLFPGVGNALEKIAEQPLPSNAEGWFAIPKWQTMAATYNEAVLAVLAMIASKREFYNYREGVLGADYLRQHARTAEMLQMLGDEQKDHDILVVPAQFGLRHRGRSVRRAREVFTASEFGLGAFAVGIMLLTHPEREVEREQLHVDCAGDEYAPGAAGRFSEAPLFSFYDGRAEFNACRVDSADEHYGSASGFLPQ